MRKFQLIILSALVFYNTVYAEVSENDLRQFKEEGKTIGRSSESSISGSFSNSKEIQETIGCEGTNINGNGMSIEEAERLSASVMQLNDENSLKAIRRSC